MDIADYAILAILVFSVWDGYRTGFVAQLVRLFGTVLAYLAAWQFHSFLTPPIDHWLVSTVFRNVRSAQTIPVANLFESGSTVPALAKAVAGVLSFGAVFFLALILIRYLGWLLNAIVRLPGLSFVNRVLGAAAGLLVAFLIVAVLIDVAAYLPQSTVRTQIENSALAPMFRQPLQELARMEGLPSSLHP